MAEAQTTVTAGAFTVEFWSSADGDHNYGSESIAAADLGTWTAAEQAAVVRAFEHWSTRLGVAAGANAPVIRVIKDESDPLASFNAAASSTTNNSATPSEGGAVLDKTNTFSRLVEGTAPARTDGLDGRIRFVQAGETYNLDRVTQLFPGDFSLERQAIHEIGHLLGISYSHDPYDIRVNASDEFTGTNTVATFGGNLPVDDTQGHVQLEYHNLTRENPFGTSFRNIPTFAPAELAILRDLNYTGLNLGDHFGLAIYQDGGDTLQTNATNFTSTADYATGVFIQADNLNFLQTADMAVSGFAGTGIRIANRDTDTDGSVITISPDALLNISGESGIGVLVSSGANLHLVHRGAITADGDDGRGFVFDFGPTFNGNLISSDDYNTYLIDQLDISGSVSADGGDGNAIEIADTAGVREINIMAGAAVSGHMRSNALVSTGNADSSHDFFRPTLTFGRLADANGQATAAGDAAFVFNYDDNITGLTRFHLDHFDGQTTLGGTVNVQDALVRNGLFTVNAAMDANGTATVADGEFRIGGTGSLDAENLILNGGVASVFTGGTVDVNTNATLNGGILIVNGMAEATNWVFNSGGSVGGNGTIIATNGFLASGTIAPGNSIGTLTIASDFTGDATTQFDVEIAPTGDTPGIDNDLTVVTGTGLIDGGAVNVIPDPGVYVVGSQYTFLQTGGALTVNNPLGINESMIDRRFIGLIEPNQYSLLMARDVDYGAIGNTPNQVSFGNYLEAVELDPDVQALRDLLDLIPNDADVANAFDQLSGEIYASQLSTMVQSDSMFLDVVANMTRSAGVPCQTFGAGGYPGGFWNTNYGWGGYDRADGNARRASSQALGTSLGFTNVVDDNVINGVVYGFENLDTEVNELNSRIDSEIHRAGVYSEYRDEFGYVRLSAIGGYALNESHRRIGIANNFAGLMGTPEAEYESWSAAGDFETGFCIPAGNATIQPLAGLRYVYVNQEGFQETNGGVANLVVQDSELDTLRSRLGARLAVRPEMMAGTSLTLDAIWMHDLLRHPVGTTGAALAVAQGSSFRAQGADLDNDRFLLAPGVSFDLPYGRLFARYRADMNRDSVRQAGDAGLELFW